MIGGWRGCPCGAAQSDRDQPAPGKSYLISDGQLKIESRMEYDPGCAYGDVERKTSDADSVKARASVVFICWSCHSGS